MSFYTELIEKCDVCYRLVRVEEQTRGVCHACIEQLSLTTCAVCGELFRCEHLSQDWTCPKCELTLTTKALTGKKQLDLPTAEAILDRNIQENMAAPAVELKHKPASASRTGLWNNDQVQFARLLAELHALGLPNFIREAEWQSLEASMDLTRERIVEILERADSAFGKIKAHVEKHGPIEVQMPLTTIKPENIVSGHKIARILCKACMATLPAASSHCNMCGHPTDCSGCGACQQCPECGDDRHNGPCGVSEDKDFGETVDELISHGLSDREIFDQLVERYGYDSVVEDLVAHIRVIKSRMFLDPFPDGDLITYLKLALYVLNSPMIGANAGIELDLSEEQMNTLRIQLHNYMVNT